MYLYFFDSKRGVYVCRIRDVSVDYGFKSPDEVSLRLIGTHFLGSIWFGLNMHGRIVCLQYRVFVCRDLLLSHAMVFLLIVQGVTSVGGKAALDCEQMKGNSCQQESFHRCMIYFLISFLV